MKRAKNWYRQISLKSLLVLCDQKAPAPKGIEAWSLMPPAGKKIIDSCDHEWECDGQTMMSIRLTCAKCGKSMMNGIEL